MILSISSDCQEYEKLKYGKEEIQNEMNSTLHPEICPTEFPDNKTYIDEEQAIPGEFPHMVSQFDRFHRFSSTSNFMIFFKIPSNHFYLHEYDY